jgi:hypothetical protein
MQSSTMLEQVVLSFKEVNKNIFQIDRIQYSELKTEELSSGYISNWEDITSKLSIEMPSDGSNHNMKPKAYVSP